VINYETFCKIRDCHDRQGLTIAQTARELGLHPRTVAKWLARARFEKRRSAQRGSVLDPFKGRITRLLDAHPYSAQQIFQKLREEGYGGGVTIVRDDGAFPRLPSTRLRGVWWRAIKINGR
jgi:transposase